MKQIFLKTSFDLGWGSSEQRISLDGQGQTSIYSPSGDSAKTVIPLNGTFNNLTIYSPAGLHPNYIVTMMVNGVASTLTCALADIQTQAKDVTHSVNVVAGDDIYFKIIVNPPGSGLGYTLAISIEFDGTQQFYSIGAGGGSMTANHYKIGGALGNGINEFCGPVLVRSNTYSICAASGTLTGIRMKNYTGSTAVGGGFIGYIRKNDILQDGTGGTVNTACTLVDGTINANNTFSLPIIPGDVLDFAIKRTGTNSTFASRDVVLSVLFTPTDTNIFMFCGGSNNSNHSSTEYRWVHSRQLAITESLVQCPVGPRGFTITGLRVDTPPPSLGKSVICTIRKNGVSTTATVTIADSAITASITGLSIPFVDGDLICLESIPVNGPTIGNQLHWGLTLQPTTTIIPTPPSDLGGIYFINPTKATRRDTYFDDGTGVGVLEKKIPNPTIRTALIGD